jgi:death-on-curing protein
MNGETRYVTRDEVIAYHRRVLLDSGQSPLVINPGRLDAAIARPQSSAFGEEAFPGLVEKAAALLQAVVVGHPFADGNKRAGLGAALLFLELNGVKRETTLPPLYDFVIAVTTGELREVEDIAARLRELFPGLE